MPIVPIGPWIPDRPTLRGPHCRDAFNVVPTAEGYEPLATINEQSEALPARCIGVTATRDLTGSTHLYAGTATKLYELTSGVWSDATRVSGGDYATSSTGRWNFAQYKDLMIATNASDAVQSITMSSGSNFAALAGSPPKAALVAAYSGFLFLGATETSQQQLRWSAIEDPESWTEGTNQAGSITFEDGGQIKALIGGDVLYVLQEYALRRVVYVGPPQVFQIDVLERARGPVNQGACVQLGGAIYYLSRDGVYVFDGQRSQSLGAEAVDEWYRDDFNISFADRVSCCVDPHHKLVVWCYVPTTSATAETERVLIYNWAAQKWSYGESDAEIINTMLTLGFTLEELDALYGTLDAYPVPLDDPSLIGGVQRWGCITRNNKAGFFTGAAAAARVETGDMQINSAGRALTRFVTPIADTSAATVSVGAKDRIADSLTWSAATAQQSTGRCAVRRSGRFHRLKLEVPAGTSWTHINAFDIDATTAGVR